MIRFLQETSDGVLNKIKADLSHIDSSINLEEMNMLTVKNLRGKLKELNENIAEMKNGRYGSWLTKEEYVRDTLLAEALDIMISVKRDIMEGEQLVPGATYYDQVSRFGNNIQGRKSIYMGKDYTGWMQFNESTAVEKARLVLRHGDKNDFREIYVGLADGRPDALNSVTLQHVTESSDEALALIEEYCDTRWDGPWPWELNAPEKLKHMIESRKEKNEMHVEEMQRQFARILREFDEGSMNQFEMVTAAQEMMKRVDSMIGDLGKLSSNGIEVMAQAKASGDEQLVGPMQDALGDPLNTAVSALTDLKASLASATSELTGDGGSSAFDMGGDDMGSPMDAMGDEPVSPMGDDAIDDVDIGGDEEERPMKSM